MRNTLVTYLYLWYNQAKAWLIPDVLDERKFVEERFRSDREGPMAYQLVGKVTAYQGYDG